MKAFIIIYEKEKNVKMNFVAEKSDRTSNSHTTYPFSCAVKK